MLPRHRGLLPAAGRIRPRRENLRCAHPLPSLETVSQQIETIHIGAHELGAVAFEKAENIVKDEHLAGTGRPRADPDGRDIESFRHAGGEIGGNAFQNDRKATRFLQGQGIVEDRGRLCCLSALHLEAAHPVYALRRQAEVTHHGDFAIDKGADHVDAACSPFEFHGRRAAPDERTGIAHRILHAEVEAQERHVGDHHRARLRPHHRFQVMVHHSHRYRQRVLEAETHVADTVADQQHVDDRISDAGGDRVIGRRHDDPAVLRLELMQLRNRNAAGAGRLLTQMAHMAQYSCACPQNTAWTTSGRPLCDDIANEPARFQGGKSYTVCGSYPPCRFKMPPSPANRGARQASRYHGRRLWERCGRRH